MATLTQLQTIVTNIIQDSSYTNDIIMGYLNQGQMEIAAGMQSAFGDFMTPPLPLLFAIDTVDTETGEAYIAMPSTFQRDLVFAADENGVEIDIANSWIQFASDYPLLDRTGTINEVIEHGGNLYYQGIPATSEEVTIHFYRLPIDMATSASKPDGIPAHLQIPLLTNYVLKELFSMIEDGIENAQVNTMKHTQLFLAALRTLELSIPHDTRGINLICSR